MLEWTQPGYIISPVGTLNFNGDASQAFRILVDKDASSVTRGLRTPKDSVPQGDGAILHRRFADGTELRFRVTFWEYEKVACASVAREISELLAQHLQAMLNGAGRYFWQPSDYADERMLDEARWLVALETHWQGGPPACTFAIDSPFPYFIDKTQQQVAVGEGMTEEITNAGNAEHFPVIYAHGATGFFEISNDTSGLEITYDSSRPGGSFIDSGDIAEIDTFRNTAYLGEGGPPGNDANLKPGIDPEQTDYFSLLPGANDITVTGADLTVLTNNAWVPH